MRTTTRSRTAAVVASVAVVTAGTLLVSVAPRADAACHLASFEQDQYAVGEAAGAVTITVFLEGNQNTCSGSVRYATEDRTATSPEDFVAAEGVLCFRAGDEQKSFDVQISDDARYEGDEMFGVRLEDAGAPDCQPDGISPGSTSSATVTVEEDDPRPAPTPATVTPTPTAEAMEPVVQATPTPSPTPAASPSPSPGGSPAPAGGSPTPLAAPEDADDGGVSGVLIGALVAAVLAVGAGVGVFLQVRRTRAP